MRLSICNIAWDASRDEGMYRCCERMGFSGVEIAATRIFDTNPYYNLENAKAWRKKLEESSGLNVPSIQSIWYGRYENIFGSDEEREALIGYTKQAILFAQVLRSGNIVFGCPKNRNGYNIGDRRRNKGIAINFFKQLGDFAKKHDTVIGLEPSPEIYHTDFINTTKEAVDFIQEVDSEGFKLNFDIGALICNGENIDLLMDSSKFINHVHISEPGLKKIRHRFLHYELYSLLSDAGYSGYVSIEMGKQESIEDIEDAMDYIRRIFI